MIKPIDARVLVEPIKASETNKTGIIYIPEVAREKPTKGMVLSVGEQATQVKEGQIVYYPKGTGTPISYNDTDYLILEQRNILCVE